MTNPINPSHDAIVIGASAGGIDALMPVFSRLPETFGIPIFLVIHRGDTPNEKLCDVFQNSCRCPVIEAMDKDLICPGHIYIAPAGYHLLVESRSKLALSVDFPVNFSRPSVDVLFESAADIYRAGLCAVVMSGANHDGCKGALKVRKAGGRIIVQSPETALFTRMPECVITKVSPDHILSPERIGSLLASMLGDTIR